MSDDGVVTRQWLRLCSRLLANALYRDMTENYYFYHCDTVCRDVLLQSSRDLKGILAALFNENTEMGAFQCQLQCQFQLYIYITQSRTTSLLCYNGKQSGP